MLSGRTSEIKYEMLLDIDIILSITHRKCF